MDRRHNFAHQTFVKTVLRSGSVLKRTALLQPRFTGNLVDRVDIQSHVGEELTDRRDHVEALRLFGIATSRREQQ
ncbi:MAG: hypothetical protein ACI9SE_002832 [Neolewinella sp.]|jgi:hypothetical protein